jgi:hypothetical protein
MYMSQHFPVDDNDCAVNTDFEDNNGTCYFSDKKNSMSDEQEVTDDYFFAHL